ncbi:DUF6966 domain-containing protein [Rathayibacter iranicus]|uniref:DUF6966 domain-containing protein n=1 Tax=Rathayibacter iranicus NCPPB 2253 = VKM Ac-1602 TaxID=1328868 RepID=A0ABX5LCN9_9MICO|nr:hypothetical protein [Rathayibacter iranicus]MWV31335.1 hypothetical protein [Rathayibacter iranicus NCPPB 2253 = VKM Ac-1602]PWJ63684.1 hypothetical protein B0H03_107153 [Rathayibacter iranicus NCPPB 2253 = VKM Ac-1602]
MSIDALRETLKALESIFISGKDKFWADVMHSLLDELDNSHDSADVSRLSRRIIHIYGGMGSFNDAVIYNNGTYPRGLNKELGILRTQLYKIANRLA